MGCLTCVPLGVDDGRGGTRGSKADRVGMSHADDDDDRWDGVEIGSRSGAQVRLADV